jgi:hypothetical protein
MLVALRGRGFAGVNELDIFLKKIDEMHQIQTRPSPLRKKA